MDLGARVQEFELTARTRRSLVEFRSGLLHKVRNALGHRREVSDPNPFPKWLFVGAVEKAHFSVSRCSRFSQSRFALSPFALAKKRKHDELVGSRVVYEAS